MAKHYSFEDMETRVSNSKVLKQYYDAICLYDWGDGQYHIDWVCTAPEAEILDWVQTVWVE